MEMLFYHNVFSLVPFKRSPSRRRGRSVPSSPERNYANENFAVMGPTDKLADSRLYRLKEPVKDYPRVAKSQEYALLGRNEKFENNVVYPMRRPVFSNSPRVSDLHFPNVLSECPRRLWYENARRKVIPVVFKR